MADGHAVRQHDVARGDFADAAQRDPQRSGNIFNRHGKLAVHSGAGAGGRCAELDRKVGGELHPSAVGGLLLDEDFLQGGRKIMDEKGELPASVHGRGGEGVRGFFGDGGKPALPGAQADGVAAQDELVGRDNLGIACASPHGFRGDAGRSELALKLKSVFERQSHPMGYFCGVKARGAADFLDKVRGGAEEGFTFGEIGVEGGAGGEGGGEIFLFREAVEETSTAGGASRAFGSSGGVPPVVQFPFRVAGEGVFVAAQRGAGGFACAAFAEDAFEAFGEHADVVVDLRVEPETGGGGIDDGGHFEGEAVGLPRGHEKAFGVRLSAAFPPGAEVAEAVGENGERLVAEAAVHRAAPVGDALGGESGGEVALGEVEQLDARVAVERVIIPVVGGEAARELRDGFGDEGEHVGPDAHAQAVRGGEAVEAVDVACEMRGETDAGDLGATERVFAEVEGFVEADMDFARGAEGRHVAQKFVGDFEGARVERTNLAAFERGAVGRTEFVEVAQLRGFYQVLGVAEEVDDGDDLDSGVGGGGDEFLEFAGRVGVGAGDAGEAGVGDGVFEVEVKLVVAPVGVAGKLREEEVEALDLAGEVPLEGADHRLREKPDLRPAWKIKRG